MADYFSDVRDRSNDEIISAWQAANPGMSRERAVHEHLQMLRNAGQRESAGRFVGELGIGGTAGEAYRNVLDALQSGARQVAGPPGGLPRAFVERLLPMLPQTLPQAVGAAIAPGARVSAAAASPIGTGLGGFAARNVGAATVPALAAGGTAMATGDDPATAAKEGAFMGAVTSVFDALGRLGRSVNTPGNRIAIGDAVVDRLGRQVIDPNIPAWRGLVRDADSLRQLQDPAVGKAALRSLYRDLEAAAAPLEQQLRSQRTQTPFTTSQGAAVTPAHMALSDLFENVSTKGDLARAAWKQAKVEPGSLQTALDAQAASDAASRTLRTRLTELDQLPGSPGLTTIYDAILPQYRMGSQLLEALRRTGPGLFERESQKGAFQRNALADAIDAMVAQGRGGDLGPAAQALAGKSLTGGQTTWGPGHLRLYEGSVVPNEAFRFGGMSIRAPEGLVIRSPDLGGNPAYQGTIPRVAGAATSVPLVNLIEGNNP